MVVRKRGRGVVKIYTSCFLLLFVAYRHLCSNIPTGKPDSENCLHSDKLTWTGYQCLTPFSLSLLKLQTCSHPKLYSSLTRREVTALSKHQKDAVRRTELSSTLRVFFLGKVLIFHCLPHQWVCDTQTAHFLSKVRFPACSFHGNSEFVFHNQPDHRHRLPRQCDMGISHGLGGFPKVCFSFYPLGRADGELSQALPWQRTTQTASLPDRCPCTAAPKLQ